MKKNLLSLLFIICSAAMPLAAQPANEARVKFDATIKYVDAGGEMLHYQDNKAIADIFNKYLPPVLKLIWADSSFAPSANCALDSLLKIINIKAFQAQAASSVEAAPGIYVAKSFTLTDMQAQSILIDPALKNQPLNFYDLPADTRVACKFQINLGHIWQLVYGEIKDSPDKEIKKLAVDLKHIKETTGIDVAAIAAGINGEAEILLTGTNMDNAALKIVLPDKNGQLTALLQRFLPPQQNNIASISTKIGDVFVIYEKGKIIAATDRKLFTVPAKRLADDPGFIRFAKDLPVDGCGFLYIDFSKDVIETVKKELDVPEDIMNIADNFIKPLTVVSVVRVEKDGYYQMAVSNISLAQLAQTIQYLPGMFAACAAVDGIIESGDDEASVIKCQSKMKEFSTACLIYAMDNKDKLPPDMDAVIAQKLIDEEVCEDIVYFGSGLNTQKITNPAATPIAVCDSFSHQETIVCVAFADGHVTTIEVPEGADEREIIGILHKEYKFPAEYLDHILKLLAEEDNEEGEK